MLFNSLHFLLFFPVVTAAYFLWPQRYRWALMAAAGAYFYMALIPVYFWALVAIILIDYFAGIAIENSPTRAASKRWLALSLAANIGLLALFKYFDFANENLTRLLELVGVENPIPFLKWALPVGLSFHTFQAMSYTIEVYRKRAPAERHLGVYAVYVLFYPQLVAGPIERPQRLLPQIRATHTFDYQNVVAGLKQMAWGMFKKVVVADRVAIFADLVFNSPQDFAAPQLLAGVLFFSIQIYCDFSGYTDIALGAARVMGYDLSPNFRYPYQALSVQDFWRRWHISLSSWFRDYLYLPLGGSRAGRLRSWCNLLIVFLVSGLWHGAAWHYVVWGGLHGLYLIVERRLAPLRRSTTDRLPTFARSFIYGGFTFALVCFAWIFFRAKGLNQALTLIKGIFNETLLSIQNWTDWSALSYEKKIDWLLSLALVPALLVVERLHVRYNLVQVVERQPFAVRMAVYMALIYGTLLLGKFSRNEFIYFQF